MPFTKAYRTHYAAVLKYVLRRTHDPESAQDIVAEVFAAAWRRRDTWLGPAEAEQLMYLYRTAYLTVQNANRAQSRLTRLFHRAQRDPLTAPEPRADEDETAQEVLARAAAARAYAALSAGDREVLALIAWEVLGARDVAKVLGLRTVDAAHSRIHRARKNLERGLVDVDMGMDMDTGGDADGDATAPSAAGRGV
ncbi:RNA polymerase sigma factor [Streptodolium elevatio]|uniref:Sigma-70 family RNA polymerase sigma factor n=1 Tax=Streptodolium elevatio TaxID=3157996 RepID=A0ABV3DF00_9ACTN